MTKTCFSIYSNKQHDISELIVNGNKIYRSKTTKYLGMMVDEKLSWAPHINHICTKLIKQIIALRTLTSFIDNDMAKQLYFAYVYPHISYGI